MKRSLLFGSLEDDLGDLSKHNNSGAFHDGDAPEALAGLERVEDERLEGLEVDLGHFVLLEEGGVVDLLASGGLADLPVDLGQLAGRAASADEGDGRVAGLELAGVVEDLDLGDEALARLEGGPSF